MKILLALGSDPQDALIAAGLGERGWTVERDATGFDAVQLVEAGGFDAVLVGAGLAEAQRLVARLRKVSGDLAVMALGSDMPLALKARLFDAGADDVLSRPIAVEEIALRILALARRLHGHRDGTIRFGALAVVPGSHAAAAGRRLPLTLMEFRVLEHLALRAGRTVHREQLLAALYGGPDVPNPKIVNVFMSKLRRTLGAYGIPAGLIGTVWGGGYMLPEPFGPSAPMPPHGAECRRVVRGADPRRFVAGRPVAGAAA